MPTYSQQRLEEKILKAVNLLIVQREIKNGKISSLVSATYIKLASDNSSATVYIAGFEDNAVLDRSIEGLNESAPFIQSRLGKFLNTKNTPKLKFLKDESLEEQDEMDRLFKLIKDDNGN